MSLEWETDCNASLEGTEVMLLECEILEGNNFVLV